MKKKLILANLLLAASLVACGGGTTGPVDDNPHCQGVDHVAKKIYVGNTAATTGAFAAVGVPFNVGLEAALYGYNQAGGYKGYSVELKHYDDGFEIGRAHV